VKHIVSVEPSNTFPEEPAYFQSPRNTEFHFTDNPNKYGQYSTFSIFGWTAEGKGRIVFQGPIESGPYASMTQNAAMITAHKQEPKTRIEISVNDTLEIAGTEYSIRLDRYGYVKLTPIS
jgi:hypothetical protein